MIKLCFNTIFKKLILISFLLYNTLAFAQVSNLEFNDLGKGNLHKYWEKYSPNQKITSSTVLNQLKEDNVLSPNDSLGLTSAKTSHNVTHNKYQQFHNGLPVEGAYFSFHSINENLIAFNGTLVSSLSKYETNSVITSSAAIDRARVSIGATKYAWEDKAYVALIQESKKDENFSIVPNPILTLYNNKDKYLLAYKMEIHAVEPQGRYTVYIDANTGNLIEMFDNLHHANSSITCSTVYHGAQSLNIDLNGSNYELTDKLGASNRNMETYLLPNNSVTYASATIPSMNSSAPISDCFNLNSTLDKAALDIHWATGVTYDFFDALGINSFDDNGTLIQSFTNYGNDNSSKNNAFWNGNVLTYGAGGGSHFPGPVTTLDVVAHEFGHALTEKYGGNLLYQGESGAINESISDMIAASVEHATIANNVVYSGLTSTSNKWIISQLNGGGIRNMSNPNLFGQPDTYNGNFWANTTGSDNGGVHTNSAVGNYWFYLLANPLGSNGNQVNDNSTIYNVTSIGFDDALAIVLESYNYLTFTSNYLDFRNATILAAQVLFNDSRVCEVINAWDAVGVGIIGESCTVQSGIAYTQTQFCTAQTISFSNLFGQNASNTYSWTLNGVTTTGYDLNINAPSIAGVYPLIQTVTDVSGEFITNQMDLIISECNPIDTAAHNAIWYFANQQGLDFSNGIAQMTSFPHQNFESGTSFSIGNDLKFYLAGSLNTNMTINCDMSLYDNAHNVIANLSPLYCSSLRIGSSAPDANNEYINLFLNSSYEAGYGVYRLTVQIDASGNVVYNNLTPVSGPAYVSTDQNSAIQTIDAIAIIPGCNSSIFWIILPLNYGNGLLVYKLDYSNTTSSFLDYGDLTLVHEYSASYGPVYATSPDGRFVALGSSIYEFDRSSGAFTYFSSAPQGGNGCFSPNSRYYYFSTVFDQNVYQYDLNASNVLLSKTIVAVFPSYYQTDLELGPDGKIYISSTDDWDGLIPINYNTRIGVINNPNVKEVNGSTMFNPFAYYLQNVNNFFIDFPDFTETATVKDEPLSIFFLQENCNTFKFTAPLCKPYYTWDFGDGTTLINSNQDEVNHTYTGTGPYTVSLTSTINGIITTVTETIDFGIDVSSLAITGPNSTCEVNTYFSGPVGFKEYAWSIVSGSATVNNSSAQQTSITNSGGNFTIQLIITDYFDCTATLVKTVSVGSPPNIEVVSSSCKTAGNCDGEVVFDITGGLAPYSYSVGTSQSGTSNGQVSISNLCVNNYSIHVTGANGCEGFKFQALNCGVALPIELLYFNAEMNENKSVSLFWETLTEINNDYFTVERSSDGINWEFIVEVDGAGNSNESISYNAIDLKPVKDLVYYRLRQTDFDLNYSFSNIITFNYTSKDEGFVEVFPNPANSFVNIELKSETIEDIKIYNILGKEVSNELSILSFTMNKVALDLRNLPNGIYYIKINSFNSKVVKRSN